MENIQNIVNDVIKDITNVPTSFCKILKDDKSQLLYKIDIKDTQKNNLYEVANCQNNLKNYIDVFSVFDLGDKF